jgi:hypothetical protein
MFFLVRKEETFVFDKQNKQRVEFPETQFATQTVHANMRRSEGRDERKEPTRQTQRTNKKGKKIEISSGFFFSFHFNPRTFF